MQNTLDAPQNRRIPKKQDKTDRLWTMEPKQRHERANTQPKKKKNGVCENKTTKVQLISVNKREYFVMV